METFLVYLLKSSGIIALFLLFYLLFLKRETFFRTNRIYLLSGLGFAIIVPFLIFTKTVWLPSVTIDQINVPDQLNVVASHKDSIDWIALMFYGYCTGVLLFAIRFAVQLLSLKRLILSGKKIRDGKFVRIETDQKSSPFSFFAYLVYNPTLHSPFELGTILAHERIHARERHSLDILVVQLFTIFQWCNPFVWWYRACMDDNLEYMADTGTIAKNADKKEYQYLLLRTGLGENRYPLAIPFFNNSIKKRIIMLNKNRSNRKNSFKYALMLPLLAGFIFLFNVRTEAQIDPTSESTTTEPRLSNDNNKYNPVTYNKERTGDFPNYDLNSNDNLDDPNKILTITKNELPAIYISDRDPLYLVDGKEISKTEFDKIDPNSIESISVWKGQRAIDKYGERGKDGVVEIILKKNYLNIPKTDYGDSLKIRTRSTVTSENKPGFEITGVADPLYLLDGKEISKSEMDKIDPSIIESINVLKGEKAIEAYGDKGKDGVIVVKTSNTWRVAKGVNAAKKITDPEASQETESSWRVGVGINAPYPKKMMNALEGYQQIWETQPNGKYPKIDEALILVDGQPSVKKDLESITIDQVKMFLSEPAGNKDAIKKYGNQAKNGVIEIVTKKE